jgi:DNA (cytosine-5)-methyltransferase 1
MLRVGTDCSGIEAPIQGLMKLKIPFTHVFCSDIDKYVIQSIKANYKPGIIFGDKDGPFPNGDITKRKLKDIPDIDLYICGFPCQPFSQAGERQGFEDRRGNVFFSCLKVIKKKQPKIFILENVKGLLNHDKGETWKVVCSELSKLKKYNVSWKIMNTRDYGIPQNRERVYMVGIKKSESKKEFEWPEKKEMKKLKDFIDISDKNICISKIFERYKDLINKDLLFINLNFCGRGIHVSKVICPCLIASSGLWNVQMSRFANIKEHFSLQGFPINFKQVISKCQMKKQIGNSMSVNVVECLISECLKCF